MKIVLILLSLNVYAVEPALLSAEEELMRAYQREYAFLLAQKSSLEAQAKEWEVRHAAKEKNLELELKAQEAKLVTLQGKNEALFEEVQTLEKRRREKSSRQASLEATWKKAKKSIHEQEERLRFVSESSKLELSPPENIQTGDIANLGRKSLDLTQAASGWSTQEGSFLTKEGSLVQGTLLRVGRVAAYGIVGDKVSLLGPGAHHVLQEIESEGSGVAKSWINGKLAEFSLVPAYLFNSLTERLEVRKTRTWMDHVANGIPPLMLGVLFFIIMWLFGLLVKT